MKKFIVLSIVLLMLAGFAITSSADVVTLFADQDVDVGTLTVVVNGTDLVVTYDITGSGWELLETHLYVGTVVPDKSAPGRFPYGPDDVDVATAGQYIRVYTIDLGTFTGTLYIAAHAEIGEVNVNGDPVPSIEDQTEETAWALAEVGIPIGKGKNWAEYFEFEVVAP
jgi:hypothetical protein